MIQTPQLHPRTLPLGLGVPIERVKGKVQKKQSKGNVTSNGKSVNTVKVLSKNPDKPWQFQPGHKPSGGRPKGSKDRFSKAMLDTWRDRQSELADVAIRLALEKGDIGALRLIVDRLVARADSQPIRWTWRTGLETIEDIAIEQRSLLFGVTDGSLTPGAAKELAQQLTGFAETVRATLQSSVRERFELDQTLLAAARADPACSAAASEFISRLHSLDLEPEAFEHPALKAAEAVANG